MISSGSIPQKIYYVSTSPIQIPVGSSWDIESKTYPQETANDTLVVDREYLVESTKRQLERYSRWKNLQITTQVDVLDNTPISDIRILSLGYASGNFVFKALIGNYCVNILSDTIIDTALTKGIKPGGKLKGKFIWGKIHSKLRLIRIGSEVHKQLVEFEKRKTLKIINKNDLQVGGVYLNLRKQPAIFLGYVNSTNYYLNDRNKPLDFYHVPVKKGMLFFAFDGDKNPQIAINDIQNKLNSRYIRLRRSHSYLEKIENVNLPNNIIAQIRKHFFDKAVKNITEFGTMRNGLDLAWRLSQYSELFNMYSISEEPVKILDAQKYLAFI